MTDMGLINKVYNDFRYNITIIKYIRKMLKLHDADEEQLVESEGMRIGHHKYLLDDAKSSFRRNRSDNGAFGRCIHNLHIRNDRQLCSVFG
jgi:hypothetical protein